MEIKKKFLQGWNNTPLSTIKWSAPNCKKKENMDFRKQKSSLGYLLR